MKTVRSSWLQKLKTKCGDNKKLFEVLAVKDGYIYLGGSGGQVWRSDVTVAQMTGDSGASAPTKGKGNKGKKSA